MRGRPINPEVTNLRRAIVKAWNKGGRSHAQIAAEFDCSPDYINTALWKARKLGWRVRSFDHTSPDTTKLRNRVVRAFNKGATQAEIGLAMGITRGAVGRLLAEARAKGLTVRRYTTSEIAARAQASHRARVGEVAYLAQLAPFQAAGHAARRKRPASQSIEPAGIPRE